MSEGQGGRAAVVTILIISASLIPLMLFGAGVGGVAGNANPTWTAFGAAVGAMLGVGFGVWVSGRITASGWSGRSLWVRILGGWLGLVLLVALAARFEATVALSVGILFPGVLAVVAGRFGAR